MARGKITLRFWIEAGLAALGGVLAIITVLWKDWIEIVFDVDPDRGSGELEWVVSIGLIAIAVVMAVLARLEWRRISLGSASAPS